MIALAEIALSRVRSEAASQRAESIRLPPYARQNAAYSVEKLLEHDFELNFGGPQPTNCPTIVEPEPFEEVDFLKRCPLSARASFSTE